MGNFNSNVIAQKKGQKAKKPDFQTLVKTIRLIVKPRKYQKMIKATSPRMMKADLADRVRIISR